MPDLRFRRGTRDGLDHPLAGDIVLFAAEGYMFNPVFFAVHGHLVTQPNVLIVPGGHPCLSAHDQEIVGFQQPSSNEPADPVGRPSVFSIAPTIAWLFHLPKERYYETTGSGTYSLAMATNKSMTNKKMTVRQRRSLSERFSRHSTM